MAAILDILTPAWLKATALGGVDLTLDDGSAFDERIFTDSLQAAVDILEQDLGIQIDRFKHTDERHDGETGAQNAFWPFRLDQRPLIKVDGLRIQYGAQPIVTIPLRWVNVVSWEHAQVHLIPTSEAIGGWFHGGSPLLIGNAFQPNAWVPGYFAFDYTAGFQAESGIVEIPEGSRRVTVTFAEAAKLRYTGLDIALEDPDEVRGVSRVNIVEKSLTGFELEANVAPVGGPLALTWSMTTMPSDMKRAIAYLAAMLPLDVAGDLIAGAGIANFSISVDGLSQSVGTTSSATNSGYGSRVIQFQKELKSIMPSLRARYRLPGIMAI